MGKNNMFLCKIKNLRRKDFFERKGKKQIDRKKRM